MKSLGEPLAGDTPSFNSASWEIQHSTRCSDPLYPQGSTLGPWDTKIIRPFVGLFLFPSALSLHMCMYVSACLAMDPSHSPGRLPFGPPCGSLFGVQLAFGSSFLAPELHLATAAALGPSPVLCLPLLASCRHRAPVSQGIPHSRVKAAPVS